MCKSISKSIYLLLSFLSLVLMHRDVFTQPLWISRYSTPTGGLQIPSGLAVDNLGNVYVIGSNRFAPGNTDVVTIKYNPANGDTVWIKRFGGSANLNDAPTAITTDNSGFVYVTGWYFNPGRDMFVIKYNASTGDSVWVRTYNGTGNGGDYSFSVAVDPSGNVYITGRSDVGGGNGQRFTTIKYNSSGVQQWVAVFTPPPPVTGIFDEARMVKVDAAGNVYVTGSSEANSSSTSDDYLTLKYNMNGVLQWQKRHPGSGTGSATDDYAVALVLDGTPDVYVTGYSNDVGANYDYVTIKYSGATGDSLAGHIYNGPGNGPDVTTAMTIDNSNFIYVTGYSQGSGTNADYATIKYNNLLVPQWIKRTSGSGTDFAFGVAVNSSNEVYVTGSSLTVSGIDYLTVKYNSVGDSVAAQIYNSGGNDFALAIGVDATSNVYVTGFSAIGIPLDTDIVTIKYPPSLTIGITPISNEVPANFTLAQNYPNPFNPVTSFKFDVPFESVVNITIYDINGRVASVLFNGTLKSGKYLATWSADGFASGVYFYKLTAEGFSQTKKMVLTK